MRTLSLVTILGLAVAGVMVLGVTTPSTASDVDTCSQADDAGNCVQTEEPTFVCPDGTTPTDDNGDGVLDERDCVIVIVDPDLRGVVTVKARCGFLLVTNREDVAMRFRYGRTLQNPDNTVKVAPGATRKINTSRRSIDWRASWSNKDPRVGDNLRVRQNCGRSTASTPFALPNTGV